MAGRQGLAFVSGDAPVVDVLGVHLERLVVVAGQLFDVTLEGELVVIGGLAMVCRCTSAVRATDDVDAVSGPDGVAGVVRALGAGTLLSDEFPGAVGDGTAIVSVDGVPIEVTNEGTALRVGGVKLDVIATLPLSPDAFDGIDLKGQLFMAAHRWALESATPVTLRTGGARATVLVATPAALVAMKLHALQDRRSGRPAKSASDTEDLVRLLSEHNTSGELAAEIAGAPYGLGALVFESAQRLLINESTIRLRSLIVSGSPTAGETDPLEFADVCAQFVDGLRERTASAGGESSPTQEPK